MLSVYSPFRTEEIPLVILLSSHTDLYLSRQTHDTSFMLFVKEVTKWQTGMPYRHRRLFTTEADWGDMNKKVMESVCHQKGMSRAVELMVQRLSSRPLRNNMFWFVAFASWQCAKIEVLIELPGVFWKSKACIFPGVLSKLPFSHLFSHSAILNLTEE